MLNLSVALLYARPGVPDGSCVQVMCIPDSITPGKDFHTTVRWCLQRPRAFHGSFDIIDRDTKDPYGSTGFTPGGAYQCGEHTYTQNVKAVTPQPDLMFKFFLQPVWGPPDLNSYDPFPNVIAEVGLNKQPDFGALVNDCAPVPTRVWNVAPTGQQNGIDFPKLPDCVTPGEPWSIRVNTHLETEDAADLRVNLQIGTGADKYLGAKDIYVGESNVYGVLSNPVATKWSDLPPKYWTSHDIEFTSKQTELVNKGDNIYIAAFMVPKGEVYDAKQEWTCKWRLHCAAGWKTLLMLFHTSMYNENIKTSLSMDTQALNLSLTLALTLALNRS
ncbi:hypothetical protein JKP88DRAFT_175213 [Tribonema minus]|uniref:Uncharacterized protein n=1 Tax=Tribonema minus TaxID=303371 RepID=A0A835ZD28_9STRA|nr:hypothetical protein JKP88DRAFT_175213 [Tribonema minus]